MIHKASSTPEKMETVIMNTKDNILLIENDKNTLSFITSSLCESGYQVTCALSGEEGLCLAASRCPDVILLALGLHDIDGYQVIRRLRAWSQTPVIVVSSRTREEDKVMALDLGADDFITKPFGTAELMARIRNALRRSISTPSASVYRALNLEINFEKHIIRLKGQDIHLTQTEYQLLALLAKNSGHVLPYNQMINSIWGPYADNNNQILRVNMANIRRKIERNPAQPQYVFTIAGIGYRMRENEEI